MSSDRLLRRREVERETGLSCRSIYRKMESGLFPRPVRLEGSSAVRWRESAIRLWKDRQPEALPRA